MADPLSVAASITGLLAVGGKLTALLAQVGRCADAPTMCRTALTELSEANSVLRQISTLVDDGLRGVPVGSRQNVLLEHVTAALVGFVMTKDELEAALDDLGLVYADSGIITGSFDRLRWVRREGEIESLMGRLQNHKASLGLILVTLQCTAINQAQGSIDRQCELFEAVISTNAALSTRLSRLEGNTTVGDANTASLAATGCPPHPTDDNDDGRTDQQQRGHNASASQNYREEVAFEIELRKSRVYRRMLILAESATADAHSETSMTTRGRRGAAASIFSALSLADISNLSQFSLPILIQEIGNSQWYIENRCRRNLEGLPEALNHIGSPHANYDIKWSAPGPAILNQGTSLSNRPLARKDKPLFTGTQSRSQYIVSLARLGSARIVFYDTAGHRAWLTNGLHALTHLLRASLRHDMNRGSAGEFLFDPALLEEHPNSSDLPGVFDFLMNRKNLELPISRNTSSNTQSEEAAVRGPQVPNAVVTTSTVLRLRDRIEQLMEILMHLIGYQRTLDALALFQPRVPEIHLKGYQFMDIATRCVPGSDDAAGVNACVVQDAAKSWVKFVRRIHAVTLFGEGFGDLLAPALDCSATCVQRRTLAEGQDHLVVAGWDLQNILGAYGWNANDPEAFILAPGIVWKKSANFETADDRGTANDEDITQMHCDSIQLLVPAKRPTVAKGSQQCTASKIEPAAVYILKGSNDPPEPEQCTEPGQCAEPGQRAEPGQYAESSVPAAKSTQVFSGCG